MAKKICAISFTSESGDDYLWCIEGTPKSIVKRIIKDFGSEAVYIYVKDIETLDSDPSFRKAVMDEVNKTKIGSLEEE